MSYVVDASVAIKWFVTEDLHEHALTLFDQPETLIAPDLICLEVANIAWKKAKRRQISPDQARFIEQANKRCIQHIYPSSEFSERALSIALDIDHKVYDLYAWLVPRQMRAFSSPPTRACAELPD